MRDYYDRRAAYYDDSLTQWFGEDGAHDRERTAVGHVLGSLPAVRTLEVACGTGLFTQYLPGRPVALDPSVRMLHRTRARLPAVALVCAAAPDLPFADRAFDRLFTAHFYGHLTEPDRLAFLAEARRVAGELIVLDAAFSDAGAKPEEWQQRTLRDGSSHTIYKRYFAAGRLQEEIGGDVLFDGRYFVVVRAART
jgi:ubiquinone/menaquinone biosynthesis C-methylase UbiE